MLYSEIFRSIQGEGHYTGVPTAWIRFFGCNLECSGFGQENPKDPSTYVLPYEKIDTTNITSVEELPVFKYGCDSSYSWSKKFVKLQKNETPEVVADRLNKIMTSPQFHLAFTGGEPMLKAAQKNQVAIMEHLNMPPSITIETNGTVPLFPFLQDAQLKYQKDLGTEFFYSVSPKMFSVSGEKDVVRPKVVKMYHDISRNGQLKFVSNGTDESWDEIEDAIVQFRDHGVDYPIWIMPVGALEETQKDNAKEIVEQTIDRGYNVSARVHCYIFGNQIGT